MTIGTPLKIQGTQDLAAHRVIERGAKKRDVASKENVGGRQVWNSPQG